MKTFTATEKQWIEQRLADGPLPVLGPRLDQFVPARGDNPLSTAAVLVSGHGKQPLPLLAYFIHGHPAASWGLN